MDKAKDNYSRLEIVQESDLKEKPEEIGISKYEVTIALINDINMHPYIKLMLTNKVVR